MIGLVVQGSTTVSYGAVPDFAHSGYQARAYAIVYSFSGIASVIGPFALGALADVSGFDAVLYALAGLTVLTICLAWVLPTSPHATAAD